MLPFFINPKIEPYALYRRLGAAAKKLLEEYVKVQGSQLARILQAALNFESQGGKPEASNELQKRSQAMTQMLSQAEDQVSALVKKRSGSQPSRLAKRCFACSSNFELDLAIVT